MPAPATALAPQLMAALVSPELEDSGMFGANTWILGCILQERRELLELWRSVVWQDRVCAKAGAKSKK